MRFVEGSRKCSTKILSMYADGWRFNRWLSALQEDFMTRYNQAANFPDSLLQSRTDAWQKAQRDVVSCSWHKADKKQYWDAINALTQAECMMEIARQDETIAAFQMQIDALKADNEALHRLIETATMLLTENMQLRKNAA